VRAKRERDSAKPQEMRAASGREAQARAKRERDSATPQEIARSLRTRSASAIARSLRRSQMELTDKQMLDLKIIDALQTCYDPEIPVNIYELGLIYGIEISDLSEVRIKMTLTAPGCPVAGSLPLEVEAKVNAIEGVKSARVDVVWDPPWNPGKMSESAKLQLGMI
jgi:FeS assembly SUF system protein